MAEQWEFDEDITITNVVCTGNVRCNVDLRRITLLNYNVEFRNSRVTIKLRKPKVTANIWSNGKIVCFGAPSAMEAQTGLRRVARIVQRAGYDVKLCPMRICNVCACYGAPFQIKLSAFANHYKHLVSYEPEISSAVIYKILELDLKATLQIYATGNIIILAPNIASAEKAAAKIYHMVLDDFRRNLTPEQKEMRAKKRVLAQQRRISL
ncbi:hypothetical protein V9T40_013960 [Parthenolecanium corni]|uniref:TATA box-binding protein-like 1 n=1 Tax=Parthenolecanium corni TaxID=536013 RepID=A0AAN9TQ04_9HEMI